MSESASEAVQTGLTAYGRVKGVFGGVAGSVVGLALAGAGIYFLARPSGDDKDAPRATPATVQSVNLNLVLLVLSEPAGTEAQVVWPTSPGAPALPTAGARVTVWYDPSSKTVSAQAPAARAGLPTKLVGGLLLGFGLLLVAGSVAVAVVVVRSRRAAMVFGAVEAAGDVGRALRGDDWVGISV